MVHLGRDLLTPKPPHPAQLLDRGRHWRAMRARWALTHGHWRAMRASCGPLHPLRATMRIVRGREPGLHPRHILGGLRRYDCVVVNPPLPQDSPRSKVCLADVALRVDIDGCGCPRGGVRCGLRLYLLVVFEEVVLVLGIALLLVVAVVVVVVVVVGAVAVAATVLLDGRGRDSRAFRLDARGRARVRMGSGARSGCVHGTLPRHLIEDGLVVLFGHALQELHALVNLLALRRPALVRQDRVKFGNLHCPLCGLNPCRGVRRHQRSSVARCRSTRATPAQPRQPTHPPLPAPTPSGARQRYGWTLVGATSCRTRTWH